MADLTMCDATPIYTTHGKQLLHDNRHFADAATTEIAEALAMLLNGIAIAEVTPAQFAFIEKVLWA